MQSLRRCSVCHLALQSFPAFLVLSSVLPLQGVMGTILPEVLHDDLNAKTFIPYKSGFLAIKSVAHSFFPSVSFHTFLHFLLTQNMALRNVDDILISYPL